MMQQTQESLWAQWRPSFRSRACGATALIMIVGLAIIASVRSAHAATYYVSSSSTGSDTRTKAEATNSATPWKTIQKALTTVRYDTTTDIIIVGAGNYAGRAQISRSSLTLRARSGERPKLVGGAGDWQIIQIDNGASAVTVSGFEVTGGHPTYADGVVVVGAAHHVTVSGNIVHDVGGGGIITHNAAVDKDGPGGTKPGGAVLTGGSDYITVSGNTIYNCCFNSPYQTSAISLHGLTKLNTLGGYHNIVQNNRVYGNIAKYPLPDAFGATKHTDGNGIIVDLTGTNGPSVIIQNNLFYKNGARGIHIFKSSNVDAVNNTCYKNLQDSDIRNGSQGNCELGAAVAGNVRFVNNIAYGIGGARLNNIWTYTPYTNGTITFRSNAYYAGSASYGLEDVYGDPKFSGAESGIFTVNTGGSGLNTGSNFLFATVDFNWNPRPQSGVVDRGAYDQ